MVVVLVVLSYHTFAQERLLVMEMAMPLSCK
jgi:hypothetical protein